MQVKRNGMRFNKYRREMIKAKREEEAKYPRKQASEEDKSAWEEIVEDRQAASFASLPIAVQGVFNAAALIIRTVVPSAVLYVVGSFAKGTYLLATDTEETARLRAENIYKRGVSDYDILVEGVGLVDKSNFPLLDGNIDVFSTYSEPKLLIPSII